MFPLYIPIRAADTANGNKYLRRRITNFPLLSNRVQGGSTDYLSFRTALSSPGLCLRLVEFDYIKNVILASQVYARPFMNALWDDVEDALSTRCGNSSGLGNDKDHRSQSDNKRVPHITYLLGQKGHRECLVKQPELPVLTLLVVWISEDATIEQRPMYIGDHTSYISRGIRGFARGRKLDAVEVVNGGRVEMQ
jgi:hypothetical protein